MQAINSFTLIINYKVLKPTQCVVIQQKSFTLIINYKVLKPREYRDDWFNGFTLIINYKVLKPVARSLNNERVLHLL